MGRASEGTGGGERDSRGGRMRRRAPGGVLRPFVQALWASEEGAAGGAGRERVLPAGTTNVVLRLSEHPLRLFRDALDPQGWTVACAVIGGPRAAAYVRDVSAPFRSVGAQLHPSGAEAVLGVPAGEIAGRHTALDEVWGHEAALARERLSEVRGLDAQIDLFERILTERILASPRLDGGVRRAVAAHAARRLEMGADVGRVVEESGYSHRRFIELFQREVGLAPKVYLRVHRVQRALALARGPDSPPWGQVALVAGFADQPHLCREMREICGLTPGEYREIGSPQALHVPVPAAEARQARSIFFKTGAGPRVHAPAVDWP